MHVVNMGYLVYNEDVVIFQNIRKICFSRLGLFVFLFAKILPVVWNKPPGCISVQHCFLNLTIGGATGAYFTICPLISNLYQNLTYFSARRVSAPKENKRKVNTPKSESAKRLSVFEGFANAFTNYTNQCATVTQPQVKGPSGKRARRVACLEDKLENMEEEVCICSSITLDRMFKNYGVLI